MTDISIRIEGEKINKLLEKAKRRKRREEKERQNKDDSRLETKEKQ